MIDRTLLTGVADEVVAYLGAAELAETPEGVAGQVKAAADLLAELSRMCERDAAQVDAAATLAELVSRAKSARTPPAPPAAPPVVETEAP